MDNETREMFSELMNAMTDGFKSVNQRMDSLEKENRDTRLLLENVTNKKIDALYEGMMDYNEKQYETNQRVDKLETDVEELKIKVG